MKENTSITDVSRLVHVLADCSMLCRSLMESQELRVASEHTLPDISALIRLVNDCGASCDIAILLLERKSHIAIDFLQVCEELSLECASVCSNYGFESFKRCARACDLVAKNCLPHLIQNDFG